MYPARTRIATFTLHLVAFLAMCASCGSHGSGGACFVEDDVGSDLTNGCFCYLDPHDPDIATETRRRVASCRASDVGPRAICCKSTKSSCGCFQTNCEVLSLSGDCKLLAHRLVPIGVVPDGHPLLPLLGRLVRLRFARHAVSRGVRPDQRAVLCGGAADAELRSVRRRGDPGAELLGLTDAPGHVVQKATAPSRARSCACQLRSAGLNRAPPSRIAGLQRCPR
jgi:hypothetical protein